MNRIRFIQVAAGLGIAIPACLLGLAEQCEASVEKIPAKISFSLNQEGTNLVKDKILNLYSAEEITPSNEIAHANVHANYTIPHTDVHNNYGGGSGHSNQHSNTKGKHTNQHSNY